jgi:hypothetical protein
MVWKSSKEIGCGWNFDCTPGSGFAAKVYFICNYDTGHKLGQQSENVGNFVGSS